jgi:hypothetical protein
LTSIAPQRLFAAAAPETAQAWVAGTLLIGTIASMAGVGLAERYGMSRRPVFAATMMILAMTAALLGSFGVQMLLAAAALQVVARFLANYAKQDFDCRAVTIAGAAARIANDQVAVMMRFIGMLLGPLWFGAFHISSPAMLGAVAVLLGLSLMSVPGLSAGAVASKKPVKREQSLERSERLFAGVAIGIYATYYLLASNIVYMLGRGLESTRASAVGGVLITTVYGAAMLTTAISTRIAKRQLSVAWVLPAPLLMLVAGVVLYSSWVERNPLMLAGAVALGCGFAFYLLAVRNYVTAAAGSESSRWLAFFNNLANTSALVAFGVMTAVVAISRLFDIPYAPLFSVGLSSLAAMTIVGMIAHGFHQRRSDSSRRVLEALNESKE